MKKERGQIEDEEDVEIIRAYQRGEFVPVRNQKKFREVARRAATSYMKKEARINIRMSNKDLLELQRKAAEEGLPYQTLISSVLHKFVNGRLKDAGAGKR